jgi:hypothetical protein
VPAEVVDHGDPLAAAQGAEGRGEGIDVKQGAVGGEAEAVGEGDAGADRLDRAVRRNAQQYLVDVLTER